MYQQKRVCPPNYLLENSHNKDKKRKRPSNKAVHLSLFPRSLKAEIFFFLPEPGSSILHCTRIISCPASIHTGKITKKELRFSSLFVRQEFNFRAYFFLKTTKCRRVISVSLPHMGVPSCHGDRGPLVFFWAFPYNGNYILRQE